MKYYRIVHDLDIEDRWYLGEFDLGEEFNPYKYSRGGELDIPESQLKIDLDVKGKKLDITITAFNSLIVNSNAVKIFNPNEIQLIPVEIKGENSLDEYWVLNVKNSIAALDLEKSVFQLDENEPELSYRSVSKIIIRRELANNLSIFRIKGFEVAIIVSDGIKNKFEANKLSGVKFIEV